MRDKTGIKQTCPYIDNVIAWLEDICDSFEIQTEDINNKRKWCIEYLEEIRRMNSELRDIANGHIDKTQDLERDNYKIDRELTDANKRILELESEIEQLESELNQYNN